MRLNEEDRDAIVTMRLQKAKETMLEVSANIQLGFWRLAANRLYYSCYYATSALLVKNGIMAEISRFYGIIISMFGNEHSPPHFHIKYGHYKALYMIKKGIVKGEIPINILKKVSEWVEIHKEELSQNWELIQNGKDVNKIEPLKY